MNTAKNQIALLVIDVQIGIFTIPGFKIYEPEAFVSRVSRLVDRARELCIPVIFVQHHGAAGSPIESGTPGCEIHSAITPQDEEIVIRKDQCDAFLNTELSGILRSLDVATLVVCGMQSEYCVDTTCRSAFGLGYKVYLVEDAHTTGDSGALTGEQIVNHHNSTLGSAFVTLCKTDNAFQELTGP